MLLVEDAEDLQLATGGYLEAHGYTVSCAGDGASARRKLADSHVDVVVLDLGLPDENGLRLLRELRDSSDVAVIVVTGRGEEPDRVVGLELGADDYLAKPFSQRELVARIEAVLRRRRPAEARSLLSYGDLAIDQAARQVSVLGANVSLTRLEYELLLFLACSPGRTYTHEQILEHVWSSSSDWQSPRTVSEHVFRVRSKLSLDEGGPAIVTVRGVGYRFDP